MARLGELLVAAGLLTVEQVEQALRAQVMWGGRIGTNLIELGYLDLDQLSQALGRQHRLAPALARHFERVDRALQQQLDPDVAEKLSCVPLMHLLRRRQVAYASVAPLAPREHAIVASELGVAPEDLVPSVAAELRIRYHLERAYRIPRETRFLRARGSTVPPMPRFEIEPVPPDTDPDLVLPTDTQELPIIAQPPEELTASDERAGTEPSVPPGAESEPPPRPDTIEEVLDEEVGGEPSEGDEAQLRARRTYVRTIADPLASESERVAVGRIAIRKLPILTEPGTAQTLGEATRAIRRSTDRDRVAELVIDALDRFVPSCDAAILFVVRGALAIGWKGFNRSGAPTPEIGVPLDEPGLLQRAVERAACMRSPASELAPIDQLLLTSLGRDGSDLVVEPVSIGDQVMCLVAILTPRDGQVGSAETIAVAAGAAFARLMRDASR